MPKYYFLHDDSVQRFSYCIALNDNSETIEWFNVHLCISSNRIKNIMSRNSTIKTVIIPGQSINSFHTWSISKTEFDKIKKTCELYTKYVEYVKLCEER
jgi:hypothetical protein